MKNLIAVTVIIILLYACSSSSTASKQKSKEENLAKQKFGIEVANLSNKDKQQSGLSHGVVITHIYSYYPANKAGIVKGDIILNLDKHTILTLEGFQELLQSYKYTYGQVTLGVSRDNKIKKIKVYLN